MEFKKWGKIRQFSDVVRQVRTCHDFKGMDDDGNAKYFNDSPYPTIDFHGTVKIHGSNMQVSYLNGEILVGKRSSLIGRDQLGVHFGANQFVHVTHQQEFLDWMSVVCKHLDVKEGQQLIVYGEFAGCFHYGTPILLADGTTMPIGKVVNSKLPLEVLTYNIEDNRLEPKKIINWFRNGKSNDWLKITYKKRRRGGKSTSVKITPNHIVFVNTDNGIVEVPAYKLKVGDAVLTPGKILPNHLLDFIKGTLLGDGSFSDYGSVSIRHSNDSQKYYNEFIKSLFGGLASYKTATSGFGSNMGVTCIKSFPEIKDMQDELTKNKSKEPTLNFLNTLNPRSLAVWYMDDGSLIKHNKEGRQIKCELHTQGFLKESVELIHKWFNSRGYFCNICKHEKYEKTRYSIRFTIGGADRFLSDISPYVIPEFNYKLPEYLHQIPKISWITRGNEYEHALVPTKIVGIESFIPKEEYLKVRYDIQVEDNSNYFANRMLVHNSGIQKGVAVSELPKAFYMFGVKILDGENTINLPASALPPCPIENVYNIEDFPTWDVEIDFNNPQDVQNDLVARTLQVEAECPVGKQLGVSGIGEGVVYRAEYKGHEYKFKVKGEKHSVSKTKTLVEVDPVVMKNIKEFSLRVATENRVKQAIQETGATSRADTGRVLKWLASDIIAEETETLKASGLEWKQAVKAVNHRARHIYFGLLDEF